MGTRTKHAAALMLLIVAGVAVNTAGIGSLLLAAEALGGVEGRTYPNAALQLLVTAAALAAVDVRLEAEIHRRAMALLQRLWPRR